MTTPLSGEPGSGGDFFVSYTGNDRAWAEWIAWQLEAAGFHANNQAWDSLPGHDFVQWMQRAIRGADHVIAVLSPSYAAANSFAAAEWSAALARDPSGARGILIPVRVADFQPDGLFAPRGYVDLVGQSEHTARATLLQGIRQRRNKPDAEPPFPGQTGALAPVEPVPRTVAGAPPPPFPAPEFGQIRMAMRQLDEEVQRFRGEISPEHGQREVLEYRFFPEVTESLVILECVDSANWDWQDTGWALEFSEIREQARASLGQTKSSPDDEFAYRMTDLMRTLSQLKEKVTEKYPQLLKDQP